MQPLQAESAVKENRILASGANTARAVTSPEEVRLAEEIIASIQVRRRQYAGSSAAETVSDDCLQSLRQRPVTEAIARTPRHGVDRPDIRMLKLQRIRAVSSNWIADKY